TVTPNNTAGVASSSPTLCVNTTLTNITHSTSGATGIGAATGLPAGVSASWASNTITISGTPTASGTFNYAIPLTGGCGSVNAIGTITVSASPSAGTLSGIEAICLNDATTFGSTITGGTWFSSDNSIATINSTTGVVTGVSAGTATMTYTVSGTGGCSNVTETRIVTVSPLSVGGVVSGSTTICSESTDVLLTLSGQIGQVVRWESAVSPFTNWIPIAHTATTYNSGPLTQETKFRAVVKSGNCTEVFAAEATLSVSSTTWNGTAWTNGEPTASKSVIISGNFTSPGTNNTPYDLRACKLTVTNNATVVISSGDSVTLDGALTVNPGCSVTFNSNANLLQNGTTNANTGSIVVKRDSAPIKRLDYTLWSSPVGLQQLQAFSPNTVSNRFYDYNTDANQYQTVDPVVTHFTPSKGYLIRVANNHPNQPTPWLGQFTGVPNNGNYSINLQNFGPGKRYNMIGNPYPSPIDADVFISNNIANGSITGTLYFWRKTNGGTNGGYCTYNLGGFTGNGESILTLPQYNENSSNVVQTGQGFFVEGTGSGTVVFNNEMRINNTVNRFMRSNNNINSTVERNRIWLNVTDTAGSFAQTMIAYMTGATQGVDQAIDGKLITDGDVALGSLIGNETYAIQGRALPFDVADVVPLSLKVITPGDYTIAIDRVDGLFANNGQIIYLRDNTTGNVHNLSEGGYTFTTASGTFDARFEVLYQTPLAVVTPVFNESQVVIYKTITNELSINTGNIVMSSVNVFDITGRLLISEKNINASQVLLKSGITSEILVFQITSNDGLKVTKKVLFPKTALKTDVKMVAKILIAEDE
ncbi:hypothetical protein IVB69_06020, partial [Flavobacterium sp. J49]|uniref:hypothetical protein n=1 Tax=Flavobacterium sp. J49 TaxID=2718534 RepID=UPI0015940C29